MLNKTFGSAVKSLALAAVAVLGVAGSAQAGYTPVTPVGPGAELGHAAILSAAYGGDFASSALNFSNGSLTATRVEDFGGSAADQCWIGDLVTAHVIARFAGYEQAFGVARGTSGGAAQTLFDVTGDALNVDGSCVSVDTSGNAFRFTRGGGGELSTSFDADNILGHDQMVSYRLSDRIGPDRYVLFFEDLSANENSDWDYNDLVIEIAGAAPHAIPLPPAVWSGLAVLLSGGVWNARSRVRAWLR